MIKKRERLHEIYIQLLAFIFAHAAYSVYCFASSSRRFAICDSNRKSALEKLS